MTSSFDRGQKTVKSRDHGQCLTDEMLTEYLEGSLDPAIKAASEVHLVGCDDCRNQLAFFMRVLRQDMTSEEAAALEAITAQWHDRKGGKTFPQRQRNRTSSRFLLAIGTVVAVLVIGLLSIWIVR